MWLQKNLTYKLLLIKMRPIIALRFIFTKDTSTTHLLLCVFAAFSILTVNRRLDRDGLLKSNPPAGLFRIGLAYANQSCSNEKHIDHFNSLICTHSSSIVEICSILIIRLNYKVFVVRTLASVYLSVEQIRFVV